MFQRNELADVLFSSSHLTTNLKQRSVRGGAVTLASQVGKFALRMVTTVVLARLLTPADFGLIAMVLAVTNIATMFKDAGLSDATLQKASISHEQVSTLFWINTAFGLLVTAMVASLGPFVAWFYSEPQLVSVTAALATMFLFGGLTAQHQALLRRHMRFGALGLIEIVAMLAGVVVAVAAGVLGAGYWALVLMHIAIAVVTAVGCWLAVPWLPGRPRRSSGVFEMLGFGAHVTGFNFANYFSRNADNILIGRFLGSTALGFYSKAYGLLMLPIAQVRSPLMSVGLPSLSRLQDDPVRYRSYYTKLLQMLAFMTFPMAVLLGVYSFEVVSIVLGPQWLAVSDVFRILAFAALIQSVNGTSGMVMLSSGNSGRYFRLGVFSAFVTVASFAIGLPWGIIGVATSYTIANYVFVVPVLAYSFRHTAVDLKVFFGATALPLAAALISAAMSRVVFVLLGSFMHQWTALALALSLAAVAYMVSYAVLPGGIAILREVKSSARYLFNRSPAHAR